MSKTVFWVQNDMSNNFKCSVIIESFSMEQLCNNFDIQVMWVSLNLPWKSHQGKWKIEIG